MQKLFLLFLVSTSPSLIGMDKHQLVQKENQPFFNDMAHNPNARLRRFFTAQDHFPKSFKGESEHSQKLHSRETFDRITKTKKFPADLLSALLLEHTPEKHCETCSRLYLDDRQIAKSLMDLFLKERAYSLDNIKPDAKDQ